MQFKMYVSHRELLQVFHDLSHLIHDLLMFT